MCIKNATLPTEPLNQNPYLSNFRNLINTNGIKFYVDSHQCVTLLDARAGNCSGSYIEFGSSSCSRGFGFGFGDKILPSLSLTNSPPHNPPHNPPYSI